MESCAGVLLGLRSKSPRCSFTEQLLLQLLAASDSYLINYQKIRHVKNQIIIITFYCGGKFKATRLVNLLPCFFKLLQSVILGKLQVPNALQYRFRRYDSNKCWSKRCLFFYLIISQLTFTCSNSTTETLEKGVKYVQS